MSTRLVISALAAVLALPFGPASAEGIEIVGGAQMGLVGTSSPSGERRTELLYDLDLTLRLSHTTDFGLTIGLELDLDKMLYGTDASAHGWSQRFGE
jgi:hypothetical protein